MRAEGIMVTHLSSFCGEIAKINVCGPFFIGVETLVSIHQSSADELNSSCSQNFVIGQLTIDQFEFLLSYFRSEHLLQQILDGGMQYKIVGKSIPFSHYSSRHEDPRQ